MRNDRANAPATFEKSESNNLNSLKCIFPSKICRVKHASTKIPKARTKYTVYLNSFNNPSIDLQKRRGVQKIAANIVAH